MKWLFTVAVLVASVGQVQAGPIIGVDFSFAGGGGSTPSNWTSFSTNGTYSNIVAEDGTITHVDFTIANMSVGGNELSILPSTVPQHSISLAGLDDYLSGTFPGLTAQFSDLHLNTDYSVWVFGLRGSSYTNDVVITGSGTPLVFTQNGGSNQLFVNDELGNSSRTLQSYALTITSSATGTITITDARTQKFAGFAIQQTGPTPVPEPSSLVLLITGAIGLFGYGYNRKRKQAAFELLANHRP